MEELNGYAPPASLNLNDFQYAIDDAIVQAIVKIGIKVNREELLKALKYDRGQYKAGYDAGFADGFIKTLHTVRCRDCKHAERYERTDGTAGYYCGHPQNTFAFGDRWDRVFKPVKKPDDFCSYGERRTNQSADVRNMGQFAGGGKTGGPNDADQH